MSQRGFPPSSRVARATLAMLTTLTAVVGTILVLDVPTGTALELPPGEVLTWGLNDSGQLGNGSPLFNRNTPLPVSGLGAARAVAAGGRHSLAIAADGTVWAWGYNGEGQLGDGTTTDRNVPVQVVGLSGVEAIAAGGDHSLAVTSDGTVWAWGSNQYGQLGTGASSALPLQVPGLSGVRTVAAGSLHSLALKADGTVWAWGLNVFGQMGDGTTVDRPAPARVEGLQDVVVLASSTHFCLAVRADGSLWAWGDNSSGQLGDGTSTMRSRPVQVSGLTGVVDAAGGDSHSLALLGDGTVWAWGRNDQGTLGDGTTTLRLTPVRTSGLSGVVHVAAGVYHSLALKADGTLWAWGQNFPYGQLGEFITLSAPNRLTPIRVSGLDSLLAVTAGRFHNLVLRSPDPSLFPPLANPDAFTTAEDTPLVVPAADLAANDSGDTLSVVAVSADAGAHGSALLQAGSIHYAPDADFNGTARFAYTVEDRLGRQAGGTVTVEVSAVNDPPFFNPVADPIVPNDGGAQSLAITGISPGPPDEAGQAVSLSAVASDPVLVSNLAISPGGAVRTLTFQPAPFRTGRVTITVTASDGQTANGTFTRTFAIDVIAGNHPPMANADSLATTKDVQLAVPAGSLTGNDTDPDGDPLTVTAVLPTAATHGTVRLAVPGDPLGPAGLAFTRTDLAVGPTGPADSRVASVVTGDFDGDGIPDLAVLASGGTVAVLRSRGDGSFESPRLDSRTTLGAATAVAVADFDRDGRLDLAIGGPPVVVLSGNGDGTFGSVRTLSAGGGSSMAAGDLNGDGAPDLVAGDQFATGNNLFIYPGNGDGTFQAPRPLSTGRQGVMQIAPADLDGDGDLDLAVANVIFNSPDSFVDTFLGHGDGTFEPPRSFPSGTPNGMGITSADFNRDGKPDVAVAGAAGTLQVLLGNGDGSLSAPRLVDGVVTEFWSGALGSGDFNGDSRPDLVFNDLLGSRTRVAVGDGAGGFAGLSAFDSQGRPPQFNPPVVLATGDYNGDGKLDFAVGNANLQTVSVFVNQTPLPALAAATVTYAPEPGFLGTASFRYVVSDGRGGGATGLVTVTVTPPGGQDTAPPQLAAVDFTPRSIDTSETDQTVLVTIRATDDLSGVAGGQVAFYGPGNPISGAFAFSSGSLQDGTFTAQATFPRFTAPGEWIVGYALLTDAAGNSREYLGAPFGKHDLDGFGLGSLTVASVPDTAPPQLVAIDFAPSSIDTSGAAQTVLITIHATDDLSGVTGGQIAFYGPGNPVSGAFALTSGSPQDGTFTAQATFPRFTAAGPWIVGYVLLSDAAGNRHEYLGAPFGRTDLDGFGLGSLAVTSVSDTTPPQLAAIEFSPGSIDPSRAESTVLVTLHATDDLAGVAGGQVAFFGPGPTVSGAFALTSGSPQDGTFTAQVTFPQFAAQGEWILGYVLLSDAAGNNHEYLGPAFGKPDLDGFGLSPLLAVPLTVVHAFAPEEGFSPLAGVIQRSDGILYGALNAAGPQDRGSLFRTAPDGSGFAVLHGFAEASDGAGPNRPLLGRDGLLYGTARSGGPGGGGTVFRISPDGSGFTVLHAFAGAAGPRSPWSGLIQGTDGALYGTTRESDGDGGTVFRLMPDGSGFAILHELDPASEGRSPEAELLLASDGLLYGTAAAGGPDDLGSLFRIGQDGQGFAVIHLFDAGLAASPTAAVIQGHDGLLYGVASDGLSDSIWRAATDGTGFAVRFSVPGEPGIEAPLLQGAGGYLYGVSSNGGDDGFGYIFRLRPDGTGFARLHSFDDVLTGFGRSGLLQAADGYLYGTADGGSLFGGGSLYRLPVCAGSEPDCDGDGVVEPGDNCGGLFNPDQLDLDGDGVGDACDQAPATPDPSNQTVSTTDAATTVHPAAATRLETPDGGAAALLPAGAVDGPRSLTIRRQPGELQVVGGMPVLASYSFQIGGADGWSFPAGRPATLIFTLPANAATDTAFAEHTLAVAAGEDTDGDGTVDAFVPIPACAGGGTTPDGRCTRVTALDRDGNGTADAYQLAAEVLHFSVYGTVVTARPNQAPEVVAGGPYTVVEGGTATLTATASDPDGDPVTLAWDLNGDGTFETPGPAVALAAAALDGPAERTVDVQASDGRATATATAGVRILNADPVLNTVAVPAGPLRVNEWVDVSATFADAGALDTHTAGWDWDDGSTSSGAVNEAGGVGSVSGRHAWSAAGLYSVGLALADDDGGAARSVKDVIVVDPDAGRLTGDVSFPSPAGAYPTNPGAAGRADLELEARYKRGRAAPEGEVKFALRDAGLRFKSRSLDWLAVRGSEAWCGGPGLVDGRSGYRFLVAVVDGRAPGGGGADRVRVRIWNEATGAVVYDNQPGNPDGAPATLKISGGNLSLHPH